MSALLISSTLLGASCTIGENDVESDLTIGGPDTRLSSISISSFFYKKDLFKFSYDNQKRLTEIKYSFPGDDEWEIIAIQYNPLTIIFEEWETQYKYIDGEDVKEAVLRERDEWKNISLNSKGYITEASVETRVYDVSMYPDDEDLNRYNLYFSYDNQGHLINSYCNDWSTEYIWRDGNLISLSFNDYSPDYYNESYTVTFEYSDVVNQHGQWDPLFPVIGAIQITGWMGKAPEYYPKKATTVGGQYGYSSDIMQFSYLLCENGYIRKSAYCDSYIDAIQLNWNYIR